MRGSSVKERGSPLLTFAKFRFVVVKKFVKIILFKIRIQLVNLARGNFDSDGSLKSRTTLSCETLATIIEEQTENDVELKT